MMATNDQEAMDGMLGSMYQSGADVVEGVLAGDPEITGGVLRSFAYSTLVGAPFACGAGSARILGLVDDVPLPKGTITSNTVRRGSDAISDPVNLIDGPSFIGTPGGDLVAVPTGTARASTRSPGIRYMGGEGGGPGLHPNVAELRMMEASSKGPGHIQRLSYSNEKRQVVNPHTGRTIPPSDPWYHYPWN